MTTEVFPRRAAAEGGGCFVEEGGCHEAHGGRYQGQGCQGSCADTLRLDKLGLVNGISVLIEFSEGPTNIRPITMDKNTTRVAAFWTTAISDVSP